MQPTTKTEALRRMKSIAGHVRGIERMLEEDTYCIDVIKQIQAVDAALNKVSGLLLDGHLHSCVITAVRGEDMAERERVLAEIASVFETSTKV
jgi:CsoR family transcriptional regulator, copper-sensing transcriptional repressor